MSLFTAAQWRLHDPRVEPERIPPTSIALVGSLISVFGLPLLFWYGVPMVGSGGLFLVSMLAVTWLCVLLLLAFAGLGSEFAGLGSEFAGLGSELDDLREAVTRPGASSNPTVPPPSMKD